LLLLLLSFLRHKRQREHIQIRHYKRTEHSIQNKLYRT